MNDTDKERPKEWVHQNITHQKSQRAEYHHGTIQKAQEEEIENWQTILDLINRQATIRDFRATIRDFRATIDDMKDFVRMAFNALRTDGIGTLQSRAIMRDKTEAFILALIEKEGTDE